MLNKNSIINKKKNKINNIKKSIIKNSIRKIKFFIKNNKKNEAILYYKTFQSILDKKYKNVFNKNKVSRIKSRIYKNIIKIV
ncbi:30S ribosomal protein S20 [Candidatus Nardonella dryophthoridicola]|uniref:Small ribosomal subunit protein bS20 n=1 Tax=endosymbiont of Rhynchophorus ferrugineus TaxID=1972133 RepID=A0A2Z5T3P6_9GAMM|nr:30S ribosomal protein S20 [Candidatus Nardonella dryophthoridicola]BBA85017.1 30S ribosomal protein S20 [endosymbiont of Rhynchophorus ferrugineus]